MRARVADLASCDVCEFSARGPLVAHLERHAHSVATSEYFPDMASGQSRAGVRCEDLQKLSYADVSFDVVTHTEVLEHVPDDARAFAEMHRVLRAGGLLLFSVPLHGGERTIERARLCDGVIEHTQPPVYHTDPLRRRGHSCASRLRTGYPAASAQRRFRNCMRPVRSCGGCRFAK